jgi:hypothetical protein
LIHRKGPTSEFQDLNRTQYRLEPFKNNQNDEARADRQGRIVGVQGDKGEKLLACGRSRLLVSSLLRTRRALSRLPTA